ncbi:MAG: hypothetical protein JO099_07415, partial [Acidobacteriia bacterium]|nr:hypothetical protein [Terriglobia bacterium]
MLSRIRSWFFGKSDVSQEDDLAQEIDHHIAMLKDELVGSGTTPEEAEVFARKKLGNRTSIIEAVHEVRSLSFLDAWSMHLRIAVRTLLRNWAAHLPAIAILALGMGMSVAMFSLVYAVLLRPLPFPNQECIQVIWKTDPLAETRVEELGYPELRDLEEGIADFEFVAVMPTSLYGYSRVLQNGRAEPVQIESSPVSRDFFRVLGVSPVL